MTTDSSESWQANKSLADCNRYMLDNELACDVEFAVGPDSQLVKAHKYVLASRSPVFFAMLFGKLAMSKDAFPISVPDLTFDAFQVLMRFIYCDDCELTGDIVLQVLYASKKYLLPALTSHCTSFLEENLHADNVCVVYEQLMLYDEKNVLDKCRSFIETRTDDILASSAFVDLSFSALENIVKFPSLSVTELTLFRSCMAWSIKECQRQNLPETPENQRSVLGNVLSYIRFPTMSLREFANEVSRTGILSAEDRCAVFEYLACRGEGELEESSEVNDAEVRVELPSSFRFPVVCRLRPQPLILRRFSTFVNSSIYSGDCSMMRLRCDRPIVIRGFGVSGSMGCDPLAELLVTVKQDRQFLFNRSMVVSDDMTGDVIQVMLNDNVPLQPALWYTVIITFHFLGDRDQGSCLRGKGGSKSMVSEGVTFEFDRSDSGSLIPEVLFCRAF